MQKYLLATNIRQVVHEPSNMKERGTYMFHHFSTCQLPALFEGACQGAVQPPMAAVHLALQLIAATFKQLR